MVKYIANIVTCCRILGSVLLLFFPAFSAAFSMTYMACGLSDMIDGTIARKTHSTSAWGAKLDTAADLVFVTVSLIKLLPTLHLSPWLWLWGIGIAMIKIGTFLWGYVAKKQLVSLHKLPNKITGLLLFLFPFTWSCVDVNYSSIAICSIATFAAIQESVYVATNRGKR